MKKLQEYLSVALKGAKHIDKIIEGYRTQIKLENSQLPEEQMDEIATRRAICLDCPLNSINARSSKEYLELFGKPYETNMSYLHCSICSCPIDRKTACLSCKCGLTDWNSEHPENIQKLKWNIYEPNSTANTATDVIYDNK